MSIIYILEKGFKKPTLVFISAHGVRNNHIRADDPICVVRTLIHSARRTITEVRSPSPLTPTLRSLPQPTAVPPLGCLPFAAAVSVSSPTRALTDYSCRNYAYLKLSRVQLVQGCSAYVASSSDGVSRTFFTTLCEETFFWKCINKSEVIASQGKEYKEQQKKHFIGSHPRCSISLQAERGYQNSLRRKMRFNQVLVSNVSKLCYRSKHKLAEKLLEEADTYGAASILDRSKFLDKVSVMLEYSNLDGLSDNERAQKQSGLDVKDGLDAFDVSFTCKRFPSIALGSSSQIELYNDSAWHSQIRTYSASLPCEEFQPILTDGKWMVPESLTEFCSPLYPTVPSVDLSVMRNEDSLLPQFQHSADDLKVEQLDLSVQDSSSHMVLGSDEFMQSILDKPISCIEGFSKKRCRQLEDNDFHTLRKLLHHFPRTYADLQNSHMGIEDGQYVIFVGRILSSRYVGRPFPALDKSSAGFFNFGIT
ncbi:hypothetical protein Cgig2_031720 [Carnegiea gigantea]|uniref:Uncharacterized protein n=1 Tax=Carnegiea gigantea TaxID=171969 RepID=A0A9Q1KRT7_9CARY|nr:hypothetical protein Cgig2_031720 [Carnegiea gigantea]